MRAETKQSGHLIKAGKGALRQDMGSNGGANLSHSSGGPAASYSGPPLHHPQTLQGGAQRSSPAKRGLPGARFSHCHHPRPRLPVLLLELPSLVGVHPTITTLSSPMAGPSCKNHRCPQQVGQRQVQSREVRKPHAESGTSVSPGPLYLRNRGREKKRLYFIPNNPFQDLNYQKHTSNN